MADNGDRAFEKKTIRLADGRQLIYYWFNGTPRPEPDPRSLETRKSVREES